MKEEKAIGTGRAFGEAPLCLPGSQVLCLLSLSPPFLSFSFVLFLFTSFFLYLSLPPTFSFLLLFLYPFLSVPSFLPFLFLLPSSPAFPFNFQHSPGVDSCPILWIAPENDKHTVSGLSKLLIHQEDPRNRRLQFSCTWEDGDLTLASNPVCSSRK